MRIIRKMLKITLIFLGSLALLFALLVFIMRPRTPAVKGSGGKRLPDSVASLDIGGDGYVDLSFGYDVSDDFAIWGGITNAFDEDPPLLGRRQVLANSAMVGMGARKADARQHRYMLNPTTSARTACSAT